MRKSLNCVPAASFWNAKLDYTHIVPRPWGFGQFGAWRRRFGGAIVTGSRGVTGPDHNPRIGGAEDFGSDKRAKSADWCVPAVKFRADLFAGLPCFRRRVETDASVNELL